MGEGARVRMQIYSSISAASGEVDFGFTVAVREGEFVFFTVLEGVGEKS